MEKNSKKQMDQKKKQHSKTSYVPQGLEWTAKHARENSCMIGPR